MAKLRKGDTVTVRSGKDRGKTGKILRVWPREGTALVERINMAKHFERRTQQNPAGGIVEREHALAISKLALVCSGCRKPTRVSWAMTGETKQRVCGRCHQPIGER